MILILLGLFIMLFSFIDYKKAFIWFLTYQLFVQFGIQLMKIWNVSIPLCTLMSFVFLIGYFLKAKKLKKRDMKFPFKIAFILIVISRILTCFTALGTFSEEFNRSITFIFQNVINIYIAWNIFSSKKDFIYFFKLITIVFFVACIYGYIEYFLQYNPYINYEKNFIGEGINFYSLDNARGYRLTSIFEHPIGAGMNFALYFTVTMYLFIKKGKRVPFMKLAFITAVLCLPLIIMTKQRSAIFFLLLISLSLIDFKKTRFYILLAFALVGLFIFSPLLTNYTYYLTSVFDQKAQKQLTGSSFSMRMMQLKYSFELFKTSPLFGLGEKYNLYISSYWSKRLLMLESLWLEQMVKHGLLGMLSYLVLVITFIFKIPKNYNLGNIRFVLYGFWIVYTITTIPSFRMFLIYILVYYLINTNETKKDNENEVIA